MDKDKKVDEKILDITSKRLSSENEIDLEEKKEQLQQWGY